MIVFPDPWDALCVAKLLPDRAVVAYAAEGASAAFSEAHIDVRLVEPKGDLNTLNLLTDAPPSAAGNDLVLAFKPSARLERSGFRFALAPAAIAGAIENKLNLPELATLAGVNIAPQGRVRAGDISFAELSARFGLPFVAQSPRGFAGRRTFQIDTAADWESVTGELKGRPMKIASWAAGRPGTSNAVVDRFGTVVVSAPILQLTGDPDLTPYSLGSCGNDFTWRPSPNPGDLPAKIAEALGPVLARRGFHGHFGIDWVWDGTQCTLIEINARLTASFALYVSHRPQLLHAHLAASAGEPIEPARLLPVDAGQLVIYNVSGEDQTPLSGPHSWPAPGTVVAPEAKRGRRIVSGPVVDEDGVRQVHPTPP